MPNQIILNNFVLGGISDSRYLGVANSVYKLIGFDIHSEPGVLKVNQALAKESGSTIDDLVKAMVPCSDGNTYLFGYTNGKIWKRTSGGTYSLEATASPAAGSAGIMDAYEYQGYIYYSMQSRLGRCAVGAAWSTRNDSYATFSNTDDTYHPINEQNLVMYVGDKNYLAQVDAGTFSANALDIKSPLRISALGRYLTDILLGSFINTNVVDTEVFRWNTWSTASFQSSDDVPEVGINCFIPTDNYNLVQCGRKGMLYTYSGTFLERKKRIPGDWSGTNQALVYSNAAVNRNGLPLFGLSNISGNPAPQGVYSYGSYSPEYPVVLNLEWLISTGHSSNVQIGAIALIGDDLLVSWKDSTGTPSYGVDHIDTAAKFANASIETREIAIGRGDKKDFMIEVCYRSMPAGCSITIEQDTNNAGYIAVSDLIVDPDNKKVYAKTTIVGANTVQFRVKPVVSGNNAPEIEQIIINYP